jgi:hypothetical protein
LLFVRTFFLGALVKKVTDYSVLEEHLCGSMSVIEWVTPTGLTKLEDGRQREVPAKKISGGYFDS